MEHEKHHYVPESYLKQFAYEKDSIIYVYDKVSKKLFSKNIKDVCYEKNFYRLSNEYLSSQSDKSLYPLSIEMEYFADSQEDGYNKVLEWIRNEAANRFNTGCHYFGLTNESKLLVAKYITIQYLRTPFIRDAVIAEEKRIGEKMIRLFEDGLANERKTPSISKLPIDFDIDSVSCHAINTYLDSDFVNRIANHLVKSYWHFYYSPYAGFYSSDNPVAIIHRCNNVIAKEYGLTDYGAEVSFPINPWLLLTIYDYRYFSVYYGTDGLFEEAVNEHIEYANVCQCAFSRRHVFSKTGDFATAKKAQILMSQ